MSSIAGAVLAAGSGTRMGQPKATLEIDGIRLLDRAVDVLRTAGCAPIYAVVRDDVSIADAIRVVNPEPERGQRSSLELAVEAAGAVDALAVVLVDVPGLTADAVRAVTDAWQPGRIAIAAARDRRTHPTVMSPELWRAALELAGPDEGARTFLTAHPELVDEVPADADPTDLDTPDDLAAWRRSR